MSTGRPGSRARLRHILGAACTLVAVLTAIAAAAGPAAPQAPQIRRPFSEEAVAHLVRAALLQYFAPESVFEISVSGSALVGEVLVVDQLQIAGRPAIWRGFRGEALVHINGLQLEASVLAGQQVTSQQLKTARAEKTTVVARSTAREVQEGLSRLSPNILRPVVRFQTGQFEVAATIRRGDRLYPVQARGTLVVDGGRRVRVVLTQAQVSGGGAPPGLVEGELAKVNPVLDLANWPLNLYIQRLVLHDDRIEVWASGRK